MAESQRSEPTPTAGRRPNTIAPNKFLVMNSEQLIAMSDFELGRFADEVLGIITPPGTKRTVLLTRIVNAALAAKDSTL